MPPNKKPSKSSGQRKPWLWPSLLAGLTLFLAIWWWATWVSVPKLDAAPEALKTIDALFTAINSHDEKRIAICRSKLEDHARNGKMSNRAMAELAKCCEKATSGSWDDAARRVYHIILNQ